MMSKFSWLNSSVMVARCWVCKGLHVHYMVLVNPVCRAGQALDKDIQTDQQTFQSIKLDWLTAWVFHIKVV